MDFESKVSQSSPARELQNSGNVLGRGQEGPLQHLGIVSIIMHYCRRDFDDWDYGVGSIAEGALVFGIFDVGTAIDARTLLLMRRRSLWDLFLC